MELSPHRERNGTLLIKVTRFIQLLQTSKDFLSQKKSREEGHVLRPPPVSQSTICFASSKSIRQEPPAPSS